jgi:hypothetical protein
VAFVALTCSNAGPVAVRDDAEAVMLDFVNPARAHRQRFRQPGQARFKAHLGLVAADTLPKLTLY